VEVDICAPCSYPETTVVFADIVGFTPWAQQTDPARVVALLDALFSRFDALAASHVVEKIKTIGDSYMAAAGAPEPGGDHAAAALGFARAMLASPHAWSHPAWPVACRSRSRLCCACRTNRDSRGETSTSKASGECRRI